MLIKVLCCFVLASTAYGWINVHEKLVGRVIHVESLRTRAEYITVSDTHDGTSYRYYMILPAILKDEICYKEHSSFLVRTCATDYVCIESVKTEYRNRFWAAEYPSGEPRETIVLTAENYPDTNIDLHFKVECQDVTLTVCRIVPRRFPDLFVVHQWQEGLHTPGRYYATLGENNPYYTWTIHAPNPTEQEKEIFRIDNLLANVEEVIADYVIVGISDTKTTTQSVSYTVSMEVESAFKKFSASAGSSISKTWQIEESSTYSQAKPKSIKIIIPAKTFAVIYHRMGNYNDQFEVGSQTYRVTAVDENGNKSDVIVTNMDEIDVGSLMKSNAPTPSGKTKKRNEREREPKENSDQRIYHHHDHYHYGEKKEL
ncbi:uncharacterized protein LOC130636712 [Hydractinia symbiolongicarpus]|uniref:uncharacterized protein LOC130636712 n=1 Tax=Hydractinia symbiolongicarpus TaxID=13093 RepID=UPI00254C8C4A|nr:uncharacterized protein LOC130636712 [Hydractinia symbiolongicarpus]